MAMQRWLIGWFILAVLVAIVVMQIRSGSITLRGGRSIRLDRRPRAYRLFIAFEIVMIAILLAGLVFIR